VTFIASRARLILELYRRRLSGLAGDQRGVSAVEFALLLPLMVTLYLGVVEISQGIGADRKVTMTARTIADLVAQTSSINNNDMTNSLNAATAVMAPFPDSKLKVTVTSVVVDANGNAKVAWSDTKNGTAKAVGSTVTLPAALNIANSSLIWSEVEYAYKPTIGYIVSGTLTLKDRIYIRGCRPASAVKTSRQPARPEVWLEHDPFRKPLHTQDQVRGRLFRDHAHGIGSDVVDLIFSIAKRDVTFFSGTVAISFL